MSLRNKVTLIGHTGKEVEMISFENGNVKASVSLATSDYYTNAKGEKVYTTAFSWFYREVCAPVSSDPKAGSLLYAFCMIIFYWLIVYWMEKKKIYDKV